MWHDSARNIVVLSGGYGASSIAVSSSERIDNGKIPSYDDIEHVINELS